MAMINNFNDQRDRRHSLWERQSEKIWFLNITLSIRLLPICVGESRRGAFKFSIPGLKDDITISSSVLLAPIYKQRAQELKNLT